MTRRVCLSAIVALSAASCVLAIDTAPTVDLGYGVYQAGYDITGDYYSFNNIRFADPPTRFAEPQAPTTVDREINNGTVARICPNAYPWWLIEQLAPQYLLTPQILEAYLYSTSFNEDCLFLDVAVSRTTFDKAASSDNGSAVLVWIFGGGFTVGNKDDEQFNPAGLISQSQIDGQDGVIVIKINYRLGLFGWLAGGDNVTKNVGLLDQRLALEWVQQNVHLFGGDPNRVTVMGESAGAGSIMHHITAYGGSNGSAPFQQAIPQSPGFEISPDSALGYDAALEAASLLTGTAITTVEQLGALDSQTLMDVNILVVNQSYYGGFTYGPAVDGGYVPDLPGILLQQGKFDHSVKVMAGHNQHESTMFVPDISSDAEFRESLEAFLFGVTNTTIDYIATVVYPDDLSGQYGYTTQTGRLQLVVNEEGFICNTRYLSTAFGNETYSYIFTLSPGVHQQDLGFTFFDGDVLAASTEGTVTDPVLAVDMQQRFTRFVQSGTPNTATSDPHWPEYGEEATLLEFDTAVSTMTDDAANARCDFWQSGAWRD